ncbi:MAG TPA: cold shock domain-containing protein [Phycisphaerae bacterium]|nr:cold shock domain-containing protein [Phycisphaerae bacterium]
MSKGTVKWFNDAKGYGFVRVHGQEQDIFVHHTSIQSEGFRTLTKGDEVDFELIMGPKGPKAEKVCKEVPEAVT